MYGYKNWIEKMQEYINEIPECQDNEKYLVKGKTINAIRNALIYLAKGKNLVNGSNLKKNEMGLKYNLKATGGGGDVVNELEYDDHPAKIKLYTEENGDNYVRVSPFTCNGVVPEFNGKNLFEEPDIKLKGKQMYYIYIEWSIRGSSCDIIVDEAVLPLWGDLWGYKSIRYLIGCADVREIDVVRDSEVVREIRNKTFNSLTSSLTIYPLELQYSARIYTHGYTKIIYRTIPVEEKEMEKMFDDLYKKLKK